MDRGTQETEQPRYDESQSRELGCLAAEKDPFKFHRRANRRSTCDEVQTSGAPRAHQLRNWLSCMMRVCSQEFLEVKRIRR
jgi:hypothetical protein